MPVSRYDNTKNENIDIQNTFPSINVESIQSNDDFFYVIKDRERLDQLARRFFGDGKYWWVICLINNMPHPFSDAIIPGKIIRIPRNINNVISKL